MSPILPDQPNELVTDPLTPERFAEIKNLLRYESSISFHSARAKDSMLLLVAEVERLTAERDAVRRNAQKLVIGWKKASEEHAQFAKSKVMDEMPGMADKQEGRSLQLLDCADELANVLKGEDPDEWSYGVGMDVLERDERDGTPGGTS